MTYDLTAATPPAVPPLKGKGTIITGIVLLLAGLVAVIAGIVGTVGTATSLLGEIGSPQSGPATFTRTFTGGTTYGVYEATTAGVGTDDDPFMGAVQVSDISVTGPSGPVTVNDTGSQVNTVGDGSRTFAEVAKFDIPSTGSYTVTVSTPGALVAVAPSLSSIGRTAVWVGLIGIGVLLGLLGLIVLIIGLVRRSSSRSAQRAVTGEPAGYSYPTPGTTAGANPYAAAPVVAAEAAAYPTYPTAVYPTDPATTAYPTDLSGQAAAEPQVVPVAAVAPAAPVQPVAPPPVAALPPAGWYPDPERPGGQRYWNGAGWTEHRA